MQLDIKLLTDTARVPTYATDGAACFDFYADISDPDQPWVSLPPKAKRAIQTGVAIKVPDGHVMLIFGRSSLGFTWNTSLSNCVGVIDSDYTGEILVSLSNHSSGSFVIDHGNRIAQGLLLPIPRVTFNEVDALKVTKRGSGGFGHTGK